MINKASKRWWIIFSISIFLCFLPYFLTFFPGVLTSDSLSSVRQSLGIEPLSNHHPILFTTLVSFFINVGVSLFNDVNIGVVLFSLFQMLAMSMILGYATYWTYSKRGSKILTAVTLLFFRLNPVITMWKDVIFSGLMVILCLLLFDIVNSDGTILTLNSSKIFYFTIIILIAFFRNNGVYIVAALTFFLLLAPKKCNSILLKINTIALLFILIMQGPVLIY